jgi:putative hemolysin
VLAGAEIAIIAVRRTRLTALIDQGRSTAHAVKRLRDDPERFIATVQIGATVISATAGAFGGYRIAADMAPLLEPLPVVGPYANQLALAIVVGAISYMTLVLGELVPKSLALRAATGYSLIVGQPLLFLSRLMRPLVWFLTASSNLVLKVFGDKTTFSESRLSPEELSLLVDEAAKSGSVHPKAGEIAMRALDFGDLRVSQVMVPRTRIVAIPLDASPEEVRRVLLEEAHANFPVFEGTLDEVRGVIATSDVLALAWERELIVLEDLLRAPYFVPESMRAADILRELQRRRLHFAVVVDERGGTAGIVTLKDLLEELVGEIFGEHEREASTERIRPQPDSSFMVPGNMPIRDANRELPFELPEGDDWSTVGGLCVALAGRIPAAGDRFSTDRGIPIEVVDASERRVRWARVGPVHGPPSE